MCRALFATILLLVSYAAVGFADTYNPVIKRGPFTGDLKIGKDMVATGHRLWGTEIVGQDLRNSRFDDCDLAGVIFRQCDLTGATFRRAVLFGVLIDDCTWGNNDFTDAVINGMARQYEIDGTGITAESLVTTWSFKNKNLAECYIPANDEHGYDFNGFNLSEAFLFNVKKASLVGCNLYKTTFFHCDLTGLDFKDAVLNRCRIRACKVDLQRLKETRGKLNGTSFEGAEFQGVVDFAGMTFGDSQLLGLPDDVAQMSNTNVSWLTTNMLNKQNITDTRSFKVGNLVNMTLNRCDFSGIDFSRQVLVNTQFSECKFDGCNFEDAVITNTVFDDCTGLTAAQLASTWNAKVGRPYGVSVPR